MLFWEINSVVNQIFDVVNNMSLDTFSATQVKSFLIQHYEALRNLADKKTELSLVVERMMETSITFVDSSWSSVSVSDGRSLKATANTAIDEILGLRIPETI